MAAALGMKLSDLTEERVRQIVEIYDSVAQTNAASRLAGFGPQLPDIVESLVHFWLWEHRFGSCRSPDTKLLIRRRGSGSDWTLEFVLDPNDDHGSDGYSVESTALMRAFTDKVEQFLLDEGIATFVPAF